jgi:hypothetical protein
VTNINSIQQQPHSEHDATIEARSPRPGKHDATIQVRSPRSGIAQISLGGEHDLSSAVRLREDHRRRPRELLSPGRRCQPRRVHRLVDDQGACERPEGCARQRLSLQPRAQHNTDRRARPGDHRRPPGTQPGPHTRGGITAAWSTVVGSSRLRTPYLLRRVCLHAEPRCKSVTAKPTRRFLSAPSPRSEC